MSGVADKTELANQRLTSTKYGNPEEILQSTSDNRPDALKFRHHSSYSNKDLSFTKYNFFHPRAKEEKWDHRSQKPGSFQGPIVGMLKKLLLTGKFDAVASFVRLELLPKRQTGGFHQRPGMSPLKQLSYYYNSEPLPANFQPQKAFPFKGTVNMPKVTFTKPLLQFAAAKPLPQIQVAQPLPQIAVGQPVLHIGVAQPLPPVVAQPMSSMVLQNGAENSYAVPEQISGLGIPHLHPELLLPQFPDQPSILMNSGSEVSNGLNGQQVQVPFETMYHQYQTMKEESNDKSYKELSKLYDIMHALKEVHSEPFAKDSKTSGTNPPTLPKTPYPAPTLPLSKPLS